MGIKVSEYVSYEIDEFAIEVCNKNHPEIKQMGDVTKDNFEKYKGMDGI